MFYDEPDTYEEPPRRREDEALEVRGPSAPSSSLNLPEIVRLARELGPRDLKYVLERAREIGTQLGRILDPNPKNQSTGAYYRWEQGGKVVEGPTIDLMQAIAYEWGRIAYQIDIVEERGVRVKLRARVIDLMSLVITDREGTYNLRPAPANFAKKPEEADRWRVMQLQAAQSKAARGVLEDVIPLAVIETALDAAREAAASMQLGEVAVTDDKGKPVLDKGGKPVKRRRTLAEAVDAAVKGLGTLSPPPDLALVEKWIGRPRAQWVAPDLSALRGLYDRWRRGEITPEGFAAEVASDDEPEVAAPADRLDSLGLGPSPSTASPRGPDAGGARSSGTAASPASASPGAGAAAPTRTVGADLDVLVRAVEAAGGTLHLATGRDRLIRHDVDLTEEHWAAVLALGQQGGRLEIVGGTTLSVPTAPTARGSVVDLEVLLGVLAAGPMAVDQAKERFKSASDPVIRKLVAARWDPIVQIGTQTGRLRVDGGIISLTTPAEPGPTDDLTLAELAEECAALGADLGRDVMQAALAEAGIPQVDGAPEEALRRLHVALLARLPDEVVGG